eukprot:gene21700-11395_t
MLVAEGCDTVPLQFAPPPSPPDGCAVLVVGWDRVVSIAASLRDDGLSEFAHASRVLGVRAMVPVLFEPACRDTNTWRGTAAMSLGSLLYAHTHHTLVCVGWYVDMADDVEQGARQLNGTVHLLRDVRRVAAAAGGAAPAGGGGDAPAGGGGDAPPPADAGDAAAG